MSRLQPIDLPKLPSFDVSNTSSSITDQFIYGDRSHILTRPKQSPVLDPFKVEFSRSDLQNVIHIITAELKAKGAKVPFIFLPFRQDDEEYKLNKFLSRIINENEFIEEELLTNVVKRTDEFTLVASLKFFWCRLPSGAIIGWKSYNKFVKLEKEKGYPKKAFLTIMPYCLSSAAHASIVYDFLDLLVSVASYTKDNKLSGRKVCKMCGVWAFNGPPKKSKDNLLSFSKGLGDWVPASDALFHIMLSFLRSILPEDEKNQKQLPKTLQSLVSSNAYPPPPTKHSDPSKLQEVSIITLSVNSPSRSPLQLIDKIGKTLTFDDAKLFYSRDDYILLKSLFRDSDHLVDRLSQENRRIVERVSQFDEPDLVVNDPFIKYKLAPGWSDDLMSFYNQEKIPSSQEFYTANISKTLVDDYFIWTWLSTIGPEETSLKRNLFGKTFMLEVELTENYKKWVIIEERDINIELFDAKKPLTLDNSKVIEADEEDDSDTELDLKLQQLRKAEEEILQKKLKKISRQDLPPKPIAKEVPLGPPLPAKSSKLKKLDQSSKKFQGKLASSIRKLSSGDHHKKHATQESKPLPAIKDPVVILPRDISEQNFKLPEFEDDDEDLSGEFKEYLQKSSIPTKKTYNDEARLANVDPLTKLVDDLSLNQLHNSSTLEVSSKQSSQQGSVQSSGQQETKPPVVSIYGLEQLQQYSPYINYNDGSFARFPAERNSYYEQRNSYHEQRNSYHEHQQQPPPQQQQQQPQYQDPNYQRNSARYSNPPMVATPPSPHRHIEQNEQDVLANSTSGSANSKRARKPPPGSENNDFTLTVSTSEQSESQYSDNPITPLNSNQQLRPLSQYSDKTYENSFVAPTPDHKLLSAQSEHELQNHLYGSPASKNADVEKPLPPSPIRDHQQLPQHHNQQYPLHEYRSQGHSTHSSPTRTAGTSPMRSVNEQGTIYGSAISSPVQSRNSHNLQHDGHKPSPASPTKSIASLQSTSPTRGYYGSSPSRNSLRDSQVEMISETISPDENVKKLASIESSASRASAIIENFNTLENELQDFLNDDATSDHTPESLKTSTLESEDSGRPRSDEARNIQPTQQMTPEIGKNAVVGDYGDGYLQQSPRPQQLQSPQVAQQSFPVPRQHAPRQQRLPNGAMSPSPQYSNMPPMNAYPPNGPDKRFVKQPIPQQYAQQPYGQPSAKPHGAPRTRQAPNNAYEQLPPGQQNLYPALTLQPDYTAQQRANAHSPARPSNLGPNYQAPVYQQQRIPPQQYYAPPPSMQQRPLNHGPSKHGQPPAGYPPQNRGRPQYAPGPYNQPPMQPYYPQAPGPGPQYMQPVPYGYPPGLHSPKMHNGPMGLQSQSDYAIQHMPPAQKVNKLHGHTDNRNTNKNLRDAIATGGFGI